MRFVSALVLFSCLVAGSIAQSLAQDVPQTALPGREDKRFSISEERLSTGPAAPIRLPAAAAPEAAAKVFLTLRGIVVEGSTVYSSADLAPLYAKLIGKRISAAEIYALAARISAKYGQDGYLVASVAVVPQKVLAQGATIRLRVAEGYIERIEWSANARKFQDFLTPCLNRVLAEHPVRAVTIERCLLLAGDLPGQKATSIIKAGQTPGGVVLAVDMTGKPFEASVEIDNRGTSSQAAGQQTSSFTLNGILGLRGSLSVSATTSIPLQQMQYGSVDWRQIVAPSGLALELHASASSSHPDDPNLKALDFTGRSTAMDMAVSYPLIRSRERNLAIAAYLFAENNSSKVLAAPFSEDRLRGVRGHVSFDSVDELFGPLGQTQMFATVSQGFDGLGSTSNDNALASVAAGRSDFTKVEASVSREQSLKGGFSLFGSIYGQWSPTALLSAEQCSFGGAQYGRGLDADASVGARCLFESGELRYDPAIPGNPFSQTQLYAYVDHGTVWQVDASASTPLQTDAAIAGLGLRLGWLDSGKLELQLARAIEGPTAPVWRAFAALTLKF